MCSSSVSPVLLDCDGGLDDIQAILLLLGQEPKGWFLIGITCVSGNVGVDQVCKNVLRILNQVNRLDIPVYKGASIPLCGVALDATEWHGQDGLGDVSLPSGQAPPDDTTIIQQLPAKDFLVQSASKYESELHLLATGPLTNLAEALKIDASFGRKLKTCTIMGGNFHGIGNSGIHAEFNFWADPEAAKEVLQDLHCGATRLVCWELPFYHPHDWAAWFEQLDALGTATSSIIRAFEAGPAANLGHIWPKMLIDELAVAVALIPGITLEEESHFCTIELKGEFTRGMLVIDRMKKLGEEENLKIVTKVDHQKAFNCVREAHMIFP